MSYTQELGIQKSKVLDIIISYLASNGDERVISVYYIVSPYLLLLPEIKRMAVETAKNHCKACYPKMCFQMCQWVALKWPVLSVKDSKLFDPPEEGVELDWVSDPQYDKFKQLAQVTQP
jgi:hypothetical protein